MRENLLIYSTEELFKEMERLRQEIKRLTQEKADLENTLRVSTEQSVHREASLQEQIQGILQDKHDLEILLEVLTQHSDRITADLYEKVVIAARESEMRLAQFLEAVPVGVYVVDANGKPYYANKMAQQIIGTLPWNHLLHSGNECHPANRLAQQILDADLAGNLFYVKHIAQQVLGEGEDFFEGIRKIVRAQQVYRAGTQEPYPGERLPLVRALHGETSSVDDVEIHRGTEIIPLEIWATPIFDASGTVLYAIEVFQDISQRRQAEAERIHFIRERAAKNAALRLNAQLQKINTKLQKEIRERQRTELKLQVANQKLHQLATCDGLTQVANRRRLDDYLQHEWQRFIRAKAHVSFVLCDVDYFKLYNDTYGHQAGDECLKKVAQAISHTAKRSTDLVARYGGEEFAVVLPYTDSQGALQVATAIQTEVAKLTILHEASTVSDYVTLSMGIASVLLTHTHRILPTTLINMADNALYTAKARGRNQVILHVIEASS